MIALLEDEQAVRLRLNVFLTAPCHCEPIPILPNTRINGFTVLKDLRAGAFTAV
jgi:hypothetical protein